MLKIAPNMSFGSYQIKSGVFHFRGRLWLFRDAIYVGQLKEGIVEVRTMTEYASLLSQNIFNRENLYGFQWLQESFDSGQVSNCF